MCHSVMSTDESVSEFGTEAVPYIARVYDRVVMNCETEMMRSVECCARE